MTLSFFLLVHAHTNALSSAALLNSCIHPCNISFFSFGVRVFSPRCLTLRHPTLTLTLLPVHSHYRSGYIPVTEDRTEEKWICIAGEKDSRRCSLLERPTLRHSLPLTIPSPTHIRFPLRSSRTHSTHPATSGPMALPDWLMWQLML